MDSPHSVVRTILGVVGARPNFVKMGPICSAFRRRADARFRLVHTGQHHDRNMSDLFFEDLGLPAPDVNLGVGSGAAVERFAEIMRRFEPVLAETRPDVVLVVGDVDSTLACALVAVKAGAPVAHVEAGLRSFDRSMPEETNRVLTDAVSSWLFVTEPSGVANLRNEGVSEDRIFFVGNVMIDALLQHREKAARSPVLKRLGLEPTGYALLTLHRPSNVDRPEALAPILRAVGEIQRSVPVVFPVHPRTHKGLAAADMEGALAGMPNLRCTEPLGYLDFLCLMDHARVVLTDSGGIQEETTALGVPCLTLRENTERPITVDRGTNQLVGTRPEAIVAAFHAATRPDAFVAERMPDLWDGKAAERIVDILLVREGNVGPTLRKGLPS